MADMVIAPRYQMRYEQLVNTPVLDRIPYFHDREIEYILEVSKAEAEKRAADAEAQVRQWQTWGIVEIAVRNPSVAEYMAHWEGRAFKAEAQVKALSRPVNDEEWERWSHEVVIPSRDFDPDERFHVLNRTNVNNLLAARLSSAKEKP